MDNKNTVIEGFKIEIEEQPDGAVCGWVSKGKYSASIGALNNDGTLERDGENIPVSDDTIAKINKWAEDNGY